VTSYIHMSWINSIKLDDYLKPENFLLIILIIATIVTPLLIYYFDRRKIPKLIFDGVWYQNLHEGTEYYVKVRREKGEGRAQGVQGFVGVKDKLDQNISRWLLSNLQTQTETETEITKHDYLVLFSTFYNDGKQYINFPGIELKQPEKINEHTPYDAYKQDRLVVEIESIRGRRKNKRFMKKIKDVVQEAKQVPL
jgi:hypothetical protein